jgi:lipoyl(octanoyl) transferase
VRRVVSTQGKQESRTLLVRSSLSSASRNDAGCIDYTRGWAWQQYFQRQQQVTQQDMLLLFEHNPVYTLGRGANEQYLSFLNKGEHDELISKLSRTARGPHSARLCADQQLLLQTNTEPEHEEIHKLVTASAASPVIAPNGAPIYRVERGGQVTYHGPGQLVVYPLLNLRRPPFQQDLHWYVRKIEQVVIETLQHYHVEGVRDNVNAGVWLDELKIAAVGVSASRWTTTHGFALNVSPDLSYFDTSVILPCGIQDRGVTSLSKVLQERGDTVPTVEEVAAVVVEQFQAVFGIETEMGPSLC